MILSPISLPTPVPLQWRIYAELGVPVPEIVKEVDGSDTVTEPGNMQVPFGGSKKMRAE